MKYYDILNDEFVFQSMELGPGMVCANNRNGMLGTGDRLPAVYRTGSLDAYRLPSRFGNKLIYPVQRTPAE